MMFVTSSYVFSNVAVDAVVANALLESTVTDTELGLTLEYVYPEIVPCACSTIV